MANVTELSYMREDGLSKMFEKLVKTSIVESFGKDLIPENYDDDTPWSLCNLLRAGRLDSYTLLYVDGQFWSGSGGRVITVGGFGAVYQAGVRTFTNPYNNLKGLQRPPYTLIHALAYQVNRARLNGVKHVMITFNEHRERLFRLMHKELLQKKEIPEHLREFKPLSGKFIINEIPQWCLHLAL